MFLHFEILLWMLGLEECNWPLKAVDWSKRGCIYDPELWPIAVAKK